MGEKTRCLAHSQNEPRIPGKIKIFQKLAEQVKQNKHLQSGREDRQYVHRKMETKQNTLQASCRQKNFLPPHFQLQTSVLYCLLGEFKNSVEVVFKTVRNKLVGYMADTYVIWKIVLNSVDDFNVEFHYVLGQLCFQISLIF